MEPDLSPISALSYFQASRTFLEMADLKDSRAEYTQQPPAEKLIEEAIRNGSVDERLVKHSHDADEALKAFAGHEGQVIEIDEATNKALLRKIDWNLIPVSVMALG